MFEVGFSEMVLIALVALLVLGPNKLPKLARDVGRWVGRARQMVRQMQDQLDHEARVAEWSLGDEDRARTLRSPPPIADVSVPNGPDLPTTAAAIPAGSDAVPAGPDAVAAGPEAVPATLPPPLAPDHAAATPDSSAHDRPLH